MLQLLMLCVSTIVFSQTRIYSVVGSSTAAGMGTSTPDSSWVNRVTKFYQQQGLVTEPHNLAVSGRNCYNGMPSSYVPPAGRDYPVAGENITAALNFSPEVIIINYPSNNFNLYSIAEIMYCLQTMKDSVNARGKTCYVTTSQPRQDGNFPDLSSRMKLKAIRDSIMNRFGNYAIDFYTDVTDAATYQILPIYSYGDGIHLNDRGHAVLFEKVKAKNIFGSAPPPPPSGCNNIIASPITAGITVSGLTAPVDAVQVFNNSWTSVFNQTYTNSPGTVTVSSMTPGSYHVTTTFYNSSWSALCNKSQDVIVPNSPPPPSGNPNCNNINMTASAGSINFSGIVGPIVGIQIMNTNWVTVYNQSYTNSPGNLSVNSLAPGTYHVTASIYNSSWISQCSKSQDVVVQNTTPPPPAAPNCNNVTMTSISGGIKLTGLIAPIASVQVSTSNWTSIYNQSFTNSRDTLTLSSLTAGTYHVKVTFSTSSYAYICDKTQDVTIQANQPPAAGDCNSIIIAPVAGGVNFKGLIAPLVAVQIFNGSWTSVYNQTFNNSPDVVNTSLSIGTYHVKVDFYTSSWNLICEKMQDVTVSTAMRPDATSAMQEMSAPIKMQIEISPNPFIESVRLNINATHNQNATIEIVDAMGRNIMEKRISLQSGSNKIILDGSRCSVGNYFLRVITTDKVQTIRITRQ